MTCPPHFSSPHSILCTGHSRTHLRRVLPFALPTCSPLALILLPPHIASNLQVPDKTKDLAETLALLRAHTDASPAPVIVHCSAGVGRTGALLAADIGIDTVTSGQRANMTDILTKLRWHRGGMVTAYEQLELAAALVAGTGGKLPPSKLARDFPPVPSGRIVSARNESARSPSGRNKETDGAMKRPSLEEKLKGVGSDTRGASDGEAVEDVLGAASDVASGRKDASTTAAPPGASNAVGGRRSHEEVLDESLKKALVIEQVLGPTCVYPCACTIASSFPSQVLGPTCVYPCACTIASSFPSQVLGPTCVYPCACTRASSFPSQVLGPTCVYPCACTIASSFPSQVLGPTCVYPCACTIASSFPSPSAHTSPSLPLLPIRAFLFLPPPLSTCTDHWRLYVSFLW
jgi:hypothetical protein